MKVVKRHGSVRAALEAIAKGNETSGGFSAESAQAILNLDDRSDGSAESQDDALLIYIGQWIERWCNEHDVKIEGIERELESQLALLHRVDAKIDEASAENLAAHRATQELVRPVRYFVGIDDYMRPFLDQSRLFRHDWELVGREDALSELDEFIRSRTARVGILCGRGGIGKSKLLFAALKRAQARDSSSRIFFVPENVPLATIAEAELPPSGSIVVIDDAHRYEDLTALLGQLNLHTPGVRVVVSTRPHALEYLKSTISVAKYDFTQMRVFTPLENLSKSDIKLLAEQALGPNFRHLSDQIIDSTWDSPLVTVIAGQLVAREAISPALLERRTDFRDTVLARFRDEMLGEVDGRVPANDCAALIEVLSAVAPANTDDKRLIRHAAKFTGISEDRIERALAAIENSGLLIRRSSTVRIAPDVLADYVLNDACLRKGVATGFADRVFNEFFEDFPGQVLRNLAELDWRNQAVGGVEANLLEKVWATIEQDYKTSGFDRQLSMLRVLHGVAYYQPQHVLRLIDYSIREMATIPPATGGKRSWGVRRTNVISEIPRLLREIAYRIDYLPYCCDILWRLGRDDTKSLSANAHHPIRVLQDIASYQQYKPVKWHEIVLERGIAWLDEEKADVHVHSPLCVLQELLAKVGHTTYSKGHSICWAAFLVDAEATKHIRQAVIARLKEAMRGSVPRIAGQALKPLGDFLLPPRPLLVCVYRRRMNHSGSRSSTMYCPAWQKHF